jgi:O-succinylbenzoic acid--CoA ligase
VIIRSLAAGSRLEVLPRFDPAAVEAAAHERGATLATLVPTAMARTDVSHFRRVVVGGSAPPAELPPNASVSYGMTETGSAVVMDGRPVRGAEVEVRDGQIHVRGPMLLRCYRDGTDPRDAGGWLATGDAGELDTDGRLAVHGRRGELIITGGENVWPVAVESVLADHPGVAEVAVVGRPDPEWGEAVTAVVVPVDRSSPPTLESLRDRAKEHLPAYAAPHRLELVDALPRTALGKVQRHHLAP